MTQRKPSASGITWQLVSRVAGLTIIFSLLIAYLLAEALGKQLDAPIALTFLSIGTALIGAESGWILVKRNGSPRGRSSDSDGPSGS